MLPKPVTLLLFVRRRLKNADLPAVKLFNKHSTHLTTCQENNHVVLKLPGCVTEKINLHFQVETYALTLEFDEFRLHFKSTYGSFSGVDMLRK